VKASARAKAIPARTTPRNIETDDEGSYEEYLPGKCAWVDYLSKQDAN
jgi:hypothetical protein